MYTMYNRQIPRVTSKSRERGNIKKKRVRWIRSIQTMLAREKMKRGSVHVIFAWKTT
jgi:hypothetical protein